MKKAIWSLLALAATPAWAEYQYYVNDSLQSINPDGLEFLRPVVSQCRGSGRISRRRGIVDLARVPIPDGTSEAEVDLTISLKASGGVYTAFLQASSDARTGSVFLRRLVSSRSKWQNPQFDAGNKNCAANFVLLQSVARGKVSLLAAFAHSCRDGMRMRMAVHSGVVLIWPDQPPPRWSSTSPPRPPLDSRELAPTGMPSGNAISLVQLGAIDRTAPSGRGCGANLLHRCFAREWN